MPTPPTYTNAFKIIGSLAEGGSEPSWGYYRSAPIAVFAYAVDYVGGGSYDYVDTVYPGISAMTSTLYRSLYPFQLQFIFNNPFGSNPQGIVVRGFVPFDPDNSDGPNVAEEDFAGGVVGATVDAFDILTSSPGTFTLDIEAGNWNGIAQDTVSFIGPITAITLP